jgi:hypothetical protein
VVLYRVSVHRVVIFLVESVCADLRGDVFVVLVRQFLKFVVLLVGLFFFFCLFLFCVFRFFSGFCKIFVLLSFSY